MRILLDMDEVLVDFTAGACRVHGVNHAQLQRNRSRGVWNIRHAIGTGITEEQFWQPIQHAGVRFWETLDLLPWALDLMKVVKRHDPHYVIVTSPGSYAESYVGKILLAKRLAHHYPDLVSLDRLVVHSDKWRMAKSNVVLIDDRPTSVSCFREEGGIGLLFPSLGNHLHKYASDPVPIIEYALDNLGVLKPC